MHVYLELKEGTSNKFWEIANFIDFAPNEVYVRYGRKGSEGVKKKFIFKDNYLAVEFMDKKIEEKKKKGYKKKKPKAEEWWTDLSKNTSYNNLIKKYSKKNFNDIG